MLRVVEELIEMTVGPFQPLRGALQASKMLTHFVNLFSVQVPDGLLSFNETWSAELALR